MKRKDVQALHGKTAKELEKMRGELEMKVATARVEKHAGKLANTSLVKTLSDDLARVKTVLRLKENEPVAEEKVEKKTKKTTK